MPIQYPLINGHRYEFASIELNINGSLLSGFKDLSYSDSLDPAKIRGNSPQVIGRTKGTYDAEGSLTVYKEEWADILLKLSLGGGYMEVPFIISVVTSESIRVQTDILSGCRIKKVEDSHSEGNEALVVKLDLDIMVITRNGKVPFVGMKR